MQKLRLKKISPNFTFQWPDRSLRESYGVFWVFSLMTLVAYSIWDQTACIIFLTIQKSPVQLYVISSLIWFFHNFSNQRMLQERPCVFFSSLRQASKKDDRTVHPRWSSIGMTRSAQQAGCVPWAGWNIHHVCNPQEKSVMLRIAMLDCQSLSKAFNVFLFLLFNICQALRARQCTWQFVCFFGSWNCWQRTFLGLF